MIIQRILIGSFGCLFLVATIGWGGEPSSKSQRPFGIEKRTPLKSSKVRGAPDPPPPFRATRVFSNISFDRPTLITSAPGTDRLFVAEHQGKIFSIPADPNCRAPDLMLDAKELVGRLNKDKTEFQFVAVYGLAFHPKFAENRYCYVCYVYGYKDRARGQHPAGTRVSRFTVSRTDPPRCDPDSEQVVISWLQGGHNGGCLKFGPDGCLYISTGDGGFAFPPDGRDSGQDVSNLLSAILRIDVDRPKGDVHYSIPPDNPFVEVKDARGEIWAYGLRNPWKISFDRKTGDLWVGDVGWELWELVYRVRKGDNYGWSLVEGRQPVHTERERGPTPIVPPTVEIPHTDGASVTGGFVYRGKKFPELVGTYVFGDWETRWIWGVKADGDKVGPRRDLVQPTVRIVGFAEKNDGELLLLDYDDGTILELERIEPSNENEKFPRRLSETGLFKSVSDHQVAPGVIPFSINAPQWADHATAERFIAVPGTSSIKMHEKPAEVSGSMFHRLMDFPTDSVLMKTISLEMERGNPKSRRRLETQLLHFDGQFWRGYSYQWNDQQTDAVLVGRAGATRAFDVKDRRAPGGRRTQPWRFPSRTDCIRCHNPWAEHTLAFNLPQINKGHEFDGVVDNQIRTFRHIGLIEDVLKQPDLENPFAERKQPKDPANLPQLAEPFDESGQLDKRARSYLHANCAHCHRFNGGGASYISVQFDQPIEKTGALGVRPTQGTFDIHDAEILAPGDPYRSVLYFRMAKLGSGRMPHIGSKIVDEAGLKLMHDWIRQLPVRADDAALIAQLINLDEPAILAREREQRKRTEWQIAKRIATSNEREKPNDDDFRQAKIQADQQAADRKAKRKNERQKLIADLLSTTTRAMQLARAARNERLPKLIQELTVAVAAKHEQAQIRDLFEPFLPDDQRSKRLGDVIQPSDILSLDGNAARGKQLFAGTAGVQCKNCHRIGEVGVNLGPDLTQIGKKYNREQLLESILEPSKNIDPQFKTYLVETSAGKVHSGLLSKKTDEAVELKTAKNEVVRIATDDIEQMRPQRKSLMPDLLLSEMTAPQVADLLVYLQGLK